MAKRHNKKVVAQLEKPSRVSKKTKNKKIQAAAELKAQQKAAKRRGGKLTPRQVEKALRHHNGAPAW